MKNLFPIAAIAAGLLDGAGAAALDQDVAPAVGPSSGVASAALIPDFSGMWSHPYFPAFEPPASGPGPVTNRSRTSRGPQKDVSNFSQLAGDYTNPILRSGAAEIVKKHGEISLNGVAYPTPSNQCWPEPVPYIFWHLGMQMLQQADKITIFYYIDHDQFHQVRMNQPHPAQVTPSWQGDSVGRYEGDTLVIDTVGIKVGPFAMVDVYGTPYTEALHVVERYRLLDYEAAKEGLERAARENIRASPNSFVPSLGLGDPNYRGKYLQLEFTVEDEGVFTMPWSATITYGRPPLDDWVESICAENIREYYNNKDSAVPTANKPDF